MTLTVLTCLLISACLWLVYHWSSGVAFSIQEGRSPLDVSSEALPYILVADAAALCIIIVFLLGGPVLAIKFAALLQQRAMARS
ncbi:hypothetical protein WS98_21900 [Burkholderia territorii]|nr:hypothetical protein WS98_21900 [Burkholderia territorii]